MMDWLDKIRHLLAGDPRTGGELNERATHRAPSRERVQAELEDDLADVTVLPEYEAVVAALDAGAPAIFVTGGAGTGKSTLIRYVQAKFSAHSAIVAPTGVAALNVGGETIHSFFRLPPRWVGEEDVRRLPDRRLYRKLRLLVVDEVSMVRCDLMDAMDRFLRVNRDRDDEPFGGVQVLLVGDLFQLPPVVPRDERHLVEAHGYRSEWFFSAHALRSTPMVSIELTEAFRQQDRDDVALLDELRLARRLETVLPRIHERCADAEGAGPGIILTCTNRDADRVNVREQAALPGQETVYHARAEGKFRKRERDVPAPVDLRLKVGSRVMFTKNDEARRWVNGTQGTVRELAEGHVSVELTSTGSIYDVTPATWIAYRYEYDEKQDRIVPREDGRYTQIPLMLAWAVTIHKSQGKTLDRVTVDLGHGAFASGQVYVALSRCRTLAHVGLARLIRRNEVKCDPVIRRFYEAIKERTDGAGA